MRRASASLLAASALVAAVSLPAASAAAVEDDSGVVTCPLGVQSTSYTPGLTLTTPAPLVDVQSSGTLGPCVSTDLQHTAGTYTFHGSGNLNCLGGGSAGTGKIDWADPATQPSRFTYTSSLALRPDGTTVLVATGPITQGDYTGHTIVNTVVITSLDLLACTTTGGLTTTSGPFLVTVL
ncbi:hypothetical protein EV562_103338 [Streptomyces sp. BK208]|uniref:hypothetical protein n=1 Tax=Streptomyces sp. BK208 TaxID=2512150 RepID=UPI00105D155F|nr:hypothetical protein [Streptomyces sp. BK208]TDT39967.1 hypothetical protein EV562_103338 [Streptomyces sp. BK208]